MKRVTADSNILISAFLRGGKPLELLELARDLGLTLLGNLTVAHLNPTVNRPCAHGSRASLRSHDDDLDA